MPDCEAKCGIAEVVIDCAGNNDSILKALKIGKNRSALILVGTPKDELRFSAKEWETINRKEINMIGSWMSYSKPFPGKEWTESINGSVINKLIKIIPMVCRCIELEHIVQSFYGIKEEGRTIIKINEGL